MYQVFCEQIPILILFLSILVRQASKQEFGKMVIYKIGSFSTLGVIFSHKIETIVFFISFLACVLSITGSEILLLNFMNIFIYEKVLVV